MTERAHKVRPAGELAAICKRVTVARVAALLGASEATVRAWARGERSPSGAARARIEEVFGITWARASSTRTASATTETSSAVVPRATPGRGRPATAPASTHRETRKPVELVGTASLAAAGLSGRERVAEIVRRIESDLAGLDSSVPTNHRAALYAQLLSATASLSRLDGEDALTVGQIQRSRAWGEIERVLLDVLRRHPGIAEEFIEALDALKKGKAQSNVAMAR